ncbi:MAG: hypothetical protein AAGA81_11525 [Acidobacteriota bacterium]
MSAFPGPQRRKRLPLPELDVAEALESCGSPAVRRRTSYEFFERPSGRLEIAL